MQVRVAIDLALDRLFTYEVPEALQKKLAIGQLLSVPFGHREARGFAMEVVAEGDKSDTSVERGGGAAPLSPPMSLMSPVSLSPPKRNFFASSTTSVPKKPAPPKPYQLRPVTAIVDETPFFSPVLLDLVRRVAAYTASPIESVLRTALPAAVLKRNAHARELLFVEPVLAPLADSPAAPLTKRQTWLYKNIVRLDGGWMQSLCRELQTTPASLRQLAAHGLVKIEARAKRRDPLARRRVLPSKPLPLNDEQAKALATILGGDLCGGRGDVASDKRDVTHGGDLCKERRYAEASQLRGVTHGGDMCKERVDSAVSVPSSPYAPLPSLDQSSSSPKLAPHVPRVPHVTLLFGVTGSGKTEVYLQAIAREQAAGRGAIVMVPEIALTPQTVQRFASRFGDRVAVLHSALSDGERYDEWHRIRSGEAQVVVGPRSAVWAPVRNLGLIVVDEEHETSYKQDELPRYNARDVAVLRGMIEGAAVVLGSATPSLESWMNVKRGKYAMATMAKRAGAGSLPAVRLVEMSGGAIYSQELLDAIRLRLERHEQTILFLNRRGYSRSVVCGGCGYVVECPECGVPYTYHRVDSCLRCHICGRWVPVPSACPQCKCPGFDYRGIGTQRAEAALRKCFAHARILRMDADSTSRRHSHDDILSTFRSGEADILLGTQMIAKGLDFPNVTLVGVLDADSSLKLSGSDFRASERTYQLISQVAGRAGRAALPGEVLVQSRDLSVSVIRLAAAGDYGRFAAEELQARKECFLPPYCHLGLVGFSSQDMRLASDWSDMYARSLQKLSGLKVSDAMPCALEKADGWYRWQVVVRAVNAAAIAKAWRWISTARPLPKTVRAFMDIDAFNLI